MIRFDSVMMLGLSARRWVLLAGLGLTPAFVSCAFVLDFDELQEGPGDAGPDSSAGTGGATGGSGGSGATGGSAGTGATGGSAGSGGSSAAGGAAGADAGPPSLTADEFGAALADAMCQTLDACVGPAIELVIAAEDCNTLFTNLIEDGYVTAIKSSVANGDLTYDGVKAKACVQALVDQATQDPPDCSGFLPAVETCKQALGGLGGTGASCKHRFECGESLTCNTSGGCAGATCQPLGKQGDPCAIDDDCDPTLQLYCSTGAVDGGDAGADAGTDAGAGATCQPFVQLGGACDSKTDECELGTFCISNVCRRISDVFTIGEGLPCFSSGSLCRTGLSCEFEGVFYFSAATCAVEKNPGDPCKLALPDECPDGYYCSANILGGGGSCLALPTANQPCANAFMPNNGLAPKCAGGTVCVNDICKTWRVLDEPCEVHEQCYSGLCQTPPDGGARVCVAPVCP